MGIKLYRVIGTHIYQQRRMRGMSQENLAKALGMSRAAIANMEIGRQAIMIPALFKICDVFNIKPSCFLDFIKETK